MVDIVRVLNLAGGTVEWMQEIYHESSVPLFLNTWITRTELKSLENILGRLFFAYSGSSIIRKPYSLSTCRQQNARSIRLTYFFPR